MSSKRSFHPPVLFLLFFVSGFCGLVYQVVWTRMAFASFGIITPVLSVVISVFMLGLSLGAWAGGRWIGSLVERSGVSAIHFYAVAEFVIGLGAFGVPHLFALGERLLLAAGPGDSFSYLSLSALVLALAILPWCLFMGVTFPWMMAYLRELEPQSQESFSYLYLANVLGAMCGTLVTALSLVEVFGFHDTLRVAASGNFLIAGVSVWLGFQRKEGLKATAGLAQSGGAARQPGAGGARTGVETANSGSRDRRFIRWVLFTTGFAAMAMEVVWTRAFAPVVKTQVYSFALVVAAYLGATFLGSLLYRRHLRQGRRRPTAELISLLCCSALLPILANDTRFVRANWFFTPDPLSVVILLASICPFCAVLGYLTPGLVDDYAAGSPAEAGSAYAVNVLGCILGPLVASYILLPEISERCALILLGLPFFGFFWFTRRTLGAKQQLGLGLLAGVLLAGSIFFSRSYEDFVRKEDPHAIVRRDYAASVISFGQGREKHLLVNGIGMTMLTPITKFMVHLPLAFHKGPPESALVICFGMGTSYRSALSWDVNTTAVELVPSVKDAFGFYHADAARCLGHPKGRVIIDDGRRYLKRTQEKFDVIVIDPPPPPQAAGSSLLYSEEFYQLAKQHLNTNGILQAWVLGEAATIHAELRSLQESFPYVRCFGSAERLGVHVLASMQPIEQCSAAELAARLPADARKDLMEWSETRDLPAYLSEVLSKEAPIEDALDPNPQIRITDDLPYNEYFLLRTLGWF